MNRLLLLSVFFACNACAQSSYLFIKKGGKKKRTYMEGSRVHFVLHDGQDLKGGITLLRNDTIYLNNAPIPRKAISAVILNERKKKPFSDAKTVLLITGGVALTTIGLSLNGYQEPGPALLAAAVIGFAPLIIKYLFGRLLYTIYRKKFRIGKKFRLQVLDFYISPRKSF